MCQFFLFSRSKEHFFLFLCFWYDCKLKPHLEKNLTTKHKDAFMCISFLAVYNMYVYFIFKWLFAAFMCISFSTDCSQHSCAFHFQLSAHSIHVHFIFNCQLTAFMCISFSTVSSQHSCAFHFQLSVCSIHVHFVFNCQFAAFMCISFSTVSSQHSCAFHFQLSVRSIHVHFIFNCQFAAFMCISFSTDCSQHLCEFLFQLCHSFGVSFNRPRQNNSSHPTTQVHDMLVRVEGVNSELSPLNVSTKLFPIYLTILQKEEKIDSKLSKKLNENIWSDWVIYITMNEIIYINQRISWYMKVFLVWFGFFV